MIYFFILFWSTSNFYFLYPQTAKLKCDRDSKFNLCTTSEWETPLSFISDLPLNEEPKTVLIHSFIKRSASRQPREHQITYIHCQNMFIG